jgi:uncharacterized protein (TIGR02217 family)
VTGFHDVRFPDAVARGATGGPEYSTDVVSVASGYEQRNQNWDLARGRWDISTGIRSREQMAEVIAFFRARKGRAYGFRFKDWSDFQAEGEALAPTGSPLTWQLVKRYASGGSEEARVITKPVSGTVVVRVDGNIVSPAIDHLTGRVTFDTEPVAQPYADFEFDVPARFDSDHLSVTMRHFDSAIVPSIPLIEIRG